MRAIIDGVDSGFSCKEVLQKYNLGTSANIIRLKNALLQKELIETDEPRVLCLGFGLRRECVFLLPDHFAALQL